MDVDDLAVRVLNDLTWYIEGNIEDVIFSDYVKELRRGSPSAMGKYSARMAVINRSEPIFVDGHWQAYIDIPYKAPTSGGEYKKSRRVEYTRDDSTGKYRVTGSYGINRLTSTVDKVVEKSIMKLASESDAVYVKIVREKI